MKFLQLLSVIALSKLIDAQPEITISEVTIQLDPAVVITPTVSNEVTAESESEAAPEIENEVESETESAAATDFRELQSYLRGSNVPYNAMRNGGYMYPRRRYDNNPHDNNMETAFFSGNFPFNLPRKQNEPMYEDDDEEDVDINIMNPVYENSEVANNFNINLFTDDAAVADIVSDSFQ